MKRLRHRIDFLKQIPASQRNGMDKQANSLQRFFRIVKPTDRYKTVSKSGGKEMRNMFIKGYILWVGLMLLGCSRPVPDKEILDVYLEKHRAGDVEGLLALHTEDVIFYLPGQPPLQGRQALRGLLEWDRVMESRLEFGQMHARGDTQWVDSVVERSRFFRLLGLAEVEYFPGTYFVFREGKIARVHVAKMNLQKHPKSIQRYEQFVQWLEKTQPHIYRKLLPRGKYRYNEENAREWLRWLEAWNKLKNPEQRNN